MDLQTISILRISEDGLTKVEDVVAVEAPFSVMVNGRRAFSFTCTPSNLREMVTGALYSRGYLVEAAQIASMQITDGEIHVSLREGDEQVQKKSVSKPDPDTERIFQTVKDLFSNPDTLFNRTGCAHSCALMRNNEIICSFEDIGRHNALDKVIGYALNAGIPRADCVIFTSGRISGDYMSKIIHAGFLVAVSRAAVTCEAVRLARANGITLYGFVRRNTANRYSP